MGLLAPGPAKLDGETNEIFGRTADFSKKMNGQSRHHGNDKMTTQCIGRSLLPDHESSPHPLLTFLKWVTHLETEAVVTEGLLLHN
jgi:hypothetical protein